MHNRFVKVSDLCHLGLLGVPIVLLQILETSPTVNHFAEQMEKDQTANFNKRQKTPLLAFS